MGDRKATWSQRPELNIETIAKVASFANYGGGDLMNICKAVGRKESAFVRQACLRNNLGYLEHCLKTHNARNLDKNQAHANISCWMEVNTDWRKLCTKERTEDNELSTPRYKNEEGGIVYRTDPLIIFNNPAVAVDFGIIDVLRHLVEEIGIDINACKWSGYRLKGDKYHLLCVAHSLSSRRYFSKSIFDYIVSREDLDVCAPSAIVGSGKPLVYQIVFFGGRDDLACCEAVVQHRSFDPNRASEMGGFTARPLHYAIAWVNISANKSRATSVAMKMVEILLKAGAEPELATHDRLAPLDRVRDVIRREGEQSEEGKLCKALASMMEKYIS